MAVLGVIAAMFVSIAIAAKKQNTDNYQRQREMYQQAAAAESYNPDVEYGMNVKVRRLNSDNKVEMSADFSKVGGYNIETDAYGYYAIRQGKDQKDTNYNLRFFRSKDAEIGPKPDEGEYWFKIYNQSGSDLELYVSTPEEDGGRFFDDEKNSCGGEFDVRSRCRHRLQCIRHQLERGSVQGFSCSFKLGSCLQCFRIPRSAGCGRW